MLETSHVVTRREMVSQRVLSSEGLSTKWAHMFSVRIISHRKFSVTEAFGRSVWILTVDTIPGLFEQRR